MSAKVWNETAELPEATTWLLEASAGTGKTYQIAGLFVLLVAEYGVPVEGILAITFTKAATAELRDRIRAHLREALARLRAPAQESDDGVVRRLRKHPAPPEVETRLELALRSFDLAPISTIHGFAQRMLQEFAFDSGTDPDLELLQDTSAVTQELVDDALASFFATASAEEVAFYGSAGFTRKLLVDTARAMCGATVREVRPAGVCERAAEKAALAALRDQARALGLRWNGAEGALAYAALAADVDAKLSDGNKLRAGSLGGYWQAVGTWLGRGAPLPDSETMNKVRRVRSTAVAAVWKAASPPVGERGWWLFCEAYDAFFVEHERFWDSFSPLATFARTVRERMEAELARRRALTFDSMLSRLAERIGAEGGVQSPIAKRIRERFQAVLVDEFQDTDAAQWKIIEAAFRDHRRLFLIGDPKQAIYAFRGADVHVYLEAKGAVDDPQHFTLGYNWRSDPQAVEAMNHLWREGSGAFGEDAIDYVNVEAKRTVRLTQPGAGLQLRWLDDHADGGVQGEPLPRKDNGLAARLAAEEVLAWLRGQRGLLEDKEGWRDPGPGDFAVLVNSHFEAQVAHWALTQLNVPAVAASKESVFATPVAGWLAAWLEAVASGGRDREARSAVVTPLFGWTADELAWALAFADRGEAVLAEAGALTVRRQDWNGWTERLRAAAERWPKHGFARGFDREASELGVYQRVLALPEGERHATDLRHLFELVHVEERTRRAGPRSLADWLRAQAGQADAAVAQRLESDARAVRIETVHVSKGLEYPIVLLPFAWSARSDQDKGGPLPLREGKQSQVDLHRPKSTPREKACRSQAAEQQREELRKLYVALTRAKHRTIAWYGPVGRDGKKTSATALGRLLMRAPEAKGFDDGAMPAFALEEGQKFKNTETKEIAQIAQLASSWATVQERLNALCETSKGTITWTHAEPPGPPQKWVAPASALVEPRTAAWPAERTHLEGPWLVTSFTGLAGGSAAPDRDEKLQVDAAAMAAGGEEAAAPTGEAVSVQRPALRSFVEQRRLSLGRGREYGSWVHGVFEELDFGTGQAKDGRELRALVQSRGERLGFGAGTGHVDELVAMVPALLATPLDGRGAGEAVRGLPAGFALRDVGRGDRLDELSFDLCLGEGTAWTRRDGSGPVEREKLDRRLGCVDPRAVYDALLQTPSVPGRGLHAWLEYQRSRYDAGKAIIGSMAGILTGSIDLVFRVGAGDRARYFLADYKTNRIGTATAGHYATDWLDWEMAIAGYPLQALIYTVALHRHLKTRLGPRRYDYDTHLGGYLYLFLRGMSGAQTPRDLASGHCLGVLAERWPKKVVEALDEALAPLQEKTR